jgi:RimJ/RimL family protein N-acetyltransferase
MSARRLSTQRLDLVTATSQHVLVHLEDDSKLARLLAAQTASDWPPPSVDENELRTTLDALHRGPDQIGWWVRYVVDRKADSGKREVIGVAGFHGPPKDGRVEIHVELVDSAGSELAGEALSALVDWAFVQDGVERIDVAQRGAPFEAVESLEFDLSAGPPAFKTKEAWLAEGPPSRRCPPLKPQPADADIRGLPPVAKDIFFRLMQEPLREVDDLRTEVRDYVKLIENAAAENPYVDDIMGRDIARVCEGLFDAIIDETPEHTRRQIQAVARYFVTEEDGDSDLAIGGLDEDAAVANAIAEHLGREDLVSDLL